METQEVSWRFRKKICKNIIKGNLKSHKRLARFPLNCIKMVISFLPRIPPAGADIVSGYGSYPWFPRAGKRFPV